MRQRSGGMVILAVSIVAGLIAALLSVGFLRGVAKTTPVLVAAKEIPAFTPLSADMFQVQQLPSAAVPADAVKDIASLNGRYARTMLLAGTVVRQGHMATASGDIGSVAAKLTEAGKLGMRAMAIPVDAATAVGGQLRDGDKVDVIAAVRLEQNTQGGSTVAAVIAQSVPVLTVVRAEGSTSKDTVVVMVTPDQATKIAYALIDGAIHLAAVPYNVGIEIEAEKPALTTSANFTKQ